MCEHHTSHVVFLTDSHAHAWLKSCVCRARITCLESSPCAHVFVPTLFDYSTFPLSADHLLSHHPVLPCAHQLHLPRCGVQIPYALSLMRTLAPLPSTTLSHCEYCHPPECQFCKTETGCKAEDKCVFPHHEVDEQPNKKPKKGYYSHKRRASDDKNAVAFVPTIWVASRKTQMRWFQKEANSPGETRCKMSWDQFEKLRFTQSTLRQASIPGNGRTIA